MRRMVLVAVLALAGCASTSRALDTEFEPAADGTFKYVTRFGPLFTLDGDGEAKRQDLLEGWLAENRLCQGGYVITERQVAKAGEFLGEPFGRLIQHGRCK